MCESENCIIAALVWYLISNILLIYHHFFKNFMALLQWMCLARNAKILSSLQSHIHRPASPYFFLSLPVAFYLSLSTTSSVSVNLSNLYLRESCPFSYSENVIGRVKYEHIFGNSILLIVLASSDDLVLLLLVCCFVLLCFSNGHPTYNFQYNNSYSK